MMSFLNSVRCKSSSFNETVHNIATQNPRRELPYESDGGGRRKPFKGENSLLGTELLRVLKSYKPLLELQYPEAGKKYDRTSLG